MPKKRVFFKPCEKRTIGGHTSMSFSHAAIKELDALSCGDFQRWSKHIDTPERVHLIELYEKRLEVLE
tara:strand:+ start:683 stop:886 length:204 start_codon:yes stop_codon:yes gene_type:complete